MENITDEQLKEMEAEDVMSGGDAKFQALVARLRYAEKEVSRLNAHIVEVAALSSAANSEWKLAKALKALREIASNDTECAQASALGEMDPYNGFDMCEVAVRVLKEIEK